MRLFISVLLLFGSLTMPSLVSAQEGDSWDFFSSGGGSEYDYVSTGGNTSQNVSLINPLGTSCNPANTDCLGNFLRSILAFVIRIGTVVVILMLVYVGYKFVTARGEPVEITKARTMFLWTVVGALILLGAQVIAVGITATVQSLGTGS